ncbi:MAG: universal stress protein [Chitinophagaceae bacterium]|nr:universal stress protein [Polaromonas sp.]
MKILLAVDGSKYTKKALAFLVNHDSMMNSNDELIVLNVQPPVPGRVKTVMGSAEVNAYHREESDKVLDPVKKFLDKHTLNYRVSSVVGHPVEEILKAAIKEKPHLIVMGTHGHGLLGRALMGSISQRVVADCDIPVLLVK